MVTDSPKHLHYLQVSLEGIHQTLSATASAKLLTKRDQQKAHARPPNFEVGDFVLVETNWLLNGKDLAVWWRLKVIRYSTFRPFSSLS
jgi:hypothetical protein